MTDLRRVAADALCRGVKPYLKHYPRGRQESRAGVHFTGCSLAGPGFNFAACVDPTPPIDEVLRLGRDFFGDDEWGVLVEGDMGHPVEAEMLARGWAVAEDEPAFVLPVIPVVPLGDVPIRPVLTEADMAAFGRVTAAAYGAPPELAAAILPSMAYARDRDIATVLAEVSGEVVAAGTSSRTGPTCVIGGLATLESHRGRGIGAAVTRHLLATAAATGCTDAVLRSGPLSVPLYERLGFRYACQHRTYAVPKSVAVL